MVDQSELAWRMLCRKYVADLCYTPMWHAGVFVRDANHRRDALESCPGDRPLILQFCSNVPEVFTEAALLAEPYCDAVDLNLGCPYFNDLFIMDQLMHESYDLMKEADDLTDPSVALDNIGITASSYDEAWMTRTYYSIGSAMTQALEWGSVEPTNCVNVAQADVFLVGETRAMVYCFKQRL